MALANHHRQRSVAATLALASAALLAFGAFWAGQRLSGLAHETTEGILEAAFTALATVCLARLSWLSAAAARDILATESAASPVHPTAGTTPTAANPRGRSGRARAASLFLALAALLATGAGTATAAPLAVTASSSAPSPDFTPSDTWTPRTAPRTSSSAPSAPDDAVASDPSCAAPTPGWTPPARSVDSDACRLLLPGERSGPSGEHVVLRGQTLWSIAAAHLPQDAPTEDVANAVRSWIAANPGLRDNPDLIHPGDVLTVPTRDAAATR